MPSDFNQLQQLVTKFRDERDWKQFHSAKNLACSISIEAAELLEHFQWSDGENGDELPEAERQAVASELADIMMYLLLFADAVKVDLPSAVHEKLEKNRMRYPIEKAKGCSKKYDQL